MSGPRIEVAPGRRLAVTLPPGDEPVALLAHGVGSSARFLVEAFAAPLARAGWRLGAVELRGHGDSDPAPLRGDHDLATHAGDLAVVAEVVGARIVGGVSLGGMAALRAVTGGLDVAAVVAVIPGWTGPAERGIGPHAAVADEIRRVGVAGMVERLRAEDGMPAWIREVVLRDYASHDEASLAAALVALDGGDAPTIEEIASLAVPLAVVGWRDDPGHPWSVAQQWADAAGQSHLVETSITAMQGDRTSFGQATVQALAALGITPG